jgi:ribosomal-protein-alanine N-acetyltransferase
LLIGRAFGAESRLTAETAPYCSGFLELWPGTPALIKAERDDLALFGLTLRARVPVDWPPELTADMREWMISKLETSPDEIGWWFYYFVYRESGVHDRVVVGSGGYKGPPNSGFVEVGYSVVPSYRRRSIASHAVDMFVRRAFKRLDVQRVIAHTFPDLAASIGVLARCGFCSIGPGTEPGTICYERRRPR